MGSVLALKVSAFLRHNRKEMLYFEHMINYDHSKTKLEREEYFRRMAGLNRRLKRRK
jgi:hypothetical protein